MADTIKEPSTSTVHTRKVLYEGRQFSFLKERITLPHNVETEMAFVRHPGSAVIVPLFDDKTIGIIKQFRHVIGQYIYEIPAGTMDPGELPEQCARRELEEETGFAASDFINLGKTYLLPAYSDEVSHIFLARNMEKTAQNLDVDEIIEVLRFNVQEILEMIDAGIITDALSILAILRTVQYLEQGE